LTLAKPCAPGFDGKRESRDVSDDGWAIGSMSLQPSCCGRERLR